MATLSEEQGTMKVWGKPGSCTAVTVCFPDAKESKCEHANYVSPPTPENADKRTYSLIVENKEKFPDLHIDKFIAYMQCLHDSSDMLPYSEKDRHLASDAIRKYVYSTDPGNHENGNEGWYCCVPSESGNFARRIKWRDLYFSGKGSNFPSEEVLKMRIATLMLYCLDSAFNLIEIEEHANDEDATSW